MYSKDNAALLYLKDQIVCCRRIDKKKCRTRIGKLR